ncbi:armadillo repeat-containing protein 10-like isoform X1 [Glandiceps talaboti]
MAATSRVIAACVSVVILGFAGVMYYLSRSKNHTSKKKKAFKLDGENDSTDGQPQKDSTAQSTSSGVGLKRVKSVSGFLSSEEAVMLVGMLATEDTDQLKKVLVTIANSAAFTPNQDLICDAGGLPLLLFLLESNCRDVQENAANALSNLAVNYSNQKSLQELQCGAVVVKLLDNDSNSDSLQIALLRLLTNQSVLTEWHATLVPALPRLFQYLNSNIRKDIRLQSLKVLVNFSCNPDLFMPIITSKVDKVAILDLLSSEDVDYLLRLLTFLANLVHSKKTLKISRKQFLPEDQQEVTFGSLMYGKKAQLFTDTVSDLKTYKDTDIANLATKICANLA